MINYEIKPSLIKILNKISKKDKSLYEQVLNKIDEIINCENINHYKNLRKPLQYLKRVRISSFVLVFQFKDDKIIFEDLQHHDKIY